MISAREIVGTVSSLYTGDSPLYTVGGTEHDRINARIVDLKIGMRQDLLPNGWEAPGMGLVLYVLDRDKVQGRKGYETAFGRVMVIGTAIAGELERCVAQMVFDRSIPEIPQFSGEGHGFGLGTPGDIQAFSDHYAFYAACDGKENLKMGIEGVKGMQDRYKTVLHLTRSPFYSRDCVPDNGALKHIATTAVNSRQFKPMFSPMEVLTG